MKRKALGSKEVRKTSYVDQKWRIAAIFGIEDICRGHRVIDVKRIKNKRVRKQCSRFIYVLYFRYGIYAYQSAQCYSYYYS